MKFTIAFVGAASAVQLKEYPQPDIRGPMPRNAHPDSTFSSHVHNDWTYLQSGEYPQPDIRGPMPRNAHPDSTFSASSSMVNSPGLPMFTGPIRSSAFIRRTKPSIRSST